MLLLLLPSVYMKSQGLVKPRLHVCLGGPGLGGDGGPHAAAEAGHLLGAELVPPVGRVRGEVGHQVHVADDEAVVGEEVAEQLLVLELQTKVREKITRSFTITEKAPSRTWLKAPTSAFTFKTLC